MAARLAGPARAGQGRRRADHRRRHRAATDEDAGPELLGEIGDQTAVRAG